MLVSELIFFGFFVVDCVDVLYVLCLWMLFFDDVCVCLLLVDLGM